MNTVKRGENAAAEGLRLRGAQIEQRLKMQPPLTDLLRAIIVHSITGSDANILCSGASGSSAKAISKSLSVPLEDVQLVLKAFKEFLQRTQDQLTRKAHGTA
jgi:hypothetical protein